GNRVAFRIHAIDLDLVCRRVRVPRVRIKRLMAVVRRVAPLPRRHENRSRLGRLGKRTHGESAKNQSRHQTRAPEVTGFENHRKGQAGGGRTFHDVLDAEAVGWREVAAKEPAAETKATSRDNESLGLTGVL